MITIGWFASTARNLVLARASPAAGTPPKAGSSTPLYAPRAGCALSPFAIFTRSCSLTDGWPPGVGEGRFPAFPSRGQQNRPCACAASIRARSAATWLSICWRFHSRRPVRTKLTPALATSAQASLPSRVFPPSGGASDSPIGKTFRPSMTRHPVASIATTLIYGLGLAHGELGAFSGVSPSRDGAWLRKPVRRHVPPVARRSKRLWAEPAPRSTGRSPGSVCSTGTCPLVAPGTPKGACAPTGHDHGRKHGAPTAPSIATSKASGLKAHTGWGAVPGPFGADTSGSAYVAGRRPAEPKEGFWSSPRRISLPAQSTNRGLCNEGASRASATPVSCDGHRLHRVGGRACTGELCNRFADPARGICRDAAAATERSHIEQGPGLHAAEVGLQEERSARPGWRPDASRRLDHRASGTRSRERRLRDAGDPDQMPRW